MADNDRKNAKKFDELGPEDQHTLFMQHFRAIKAKVVELDKVRAELKDLKGVAKLDGIVIGDIDFALRAAKIEKPSIIVDELKRQTQIAHWLNLPVDFQPDMFAAPDLPAIEKAEAEGRADAAQGKDNANSYPKNGDQWQAYERGFNAQTERNLANFKKKLEANKASADGRQASKPKAAAAAAEGGKSDFVEKNKDANLKTDAQIRAQAEAMAGGKSATTPPAAAAH